MAAGLSFTAYYARRIIKWGGVVLLVYLVGYYGIKAGIAYWKALHPPKQPPPKVEFGLMPKIDFPDQPNLAFRYRLETIQGGLPTNLPDRAEVYVLHQPVPNFLDYNQGVEIARSLGFTDDPIPVDPPLYRWRTLDPIPGLLELDVTTRKFDYIYDWQSRQYFQSPSQLLTAEQAFSAVRSRLSQAGYWGPDWNQGSYATFFYKMVNGQLIEVDHFSQADFIQVNLKRKPLEELELVSLDPVRPAVWGLVSRVRQQVVELHYHYQPVTDKHSDYPLAGLATVWQELTANQLYVARVGENIPGEEVVIRHFRLAYLIPPKTADYLQPIYVIQGDRGFMAYAQAVDRRLIK